MKIMEKNVTFIGTGNMGGALIRAACRSMDPQRIHITDHNLTIAKTLAAETGCQIIESNESAAALGGYLFLCVKPQVMGKVLEQLSPVLNSLMEQDKAPVLVSIAAGLTIEHIRNDLVGCCSSLPIVRIMPNTPAAIGKGMLAVSLDEQADDSILADIRTILSDAGKIDRLPESLMDQFTAISGCAPAFVYLFIEALTDGGVLTGLGRAQAMTYAAQTIMGAASMVLETGQHPGQLKDAVCSPGGSTIAGVAALEKNGFRSAAIEAVVASYEKSKNLR